MKPATQPLRCSCGALKGEVELSHYVNRGICYCRDCQAFAHFLGRAHEILDAQGGSDIIQTAPRWVTFTAGRENLACMRLTDKGMHRWYASCCKAPIGNTLATPKFSFVGLVHTCLRSAPRSLDEAFGPARARFNTGSARGAQKLKDKRVFVAISGLGAMMLRERISGGYRRTPFFSPDTGRPVVLPRVLSAEELKRLRDEVERGSRR